MSAALAAVRGDAGCEEWVSIAGAVVLLRFANDAVRAAFFPALQHLACPATTPEMVIIFWDSASTGVDMPPPVWPLDAYGDRGEIRSFAQTGIRAAFSVDGPTLELWDVASVQASVWVRDVTTLPTHERAAPARRILSWWLEHQGQQMIHAGAVGIDDACVLLAGKGGSGKSNTALLCRRAGFQHLADDYCVLERSGQPIVHRLYGSAKVWAPDLSRLGVNPSGLVTSTTRDDEKVLFMVDAVTSGASAPPSACAALPVAAIVLPRVRLTAPTSIEAADSGEATRAIAVSTIAQQPYAGSLVLQRVAALARQRPSFRLNLGPDSVERAPVVLRHLLVSLAKRHSA